MIIESGIVEAELAACAAVTGDLNVETASFLQPEVHKITAIIVIMANNEEVFFIM